MGLCPKLMFVAFLALALDTVCSDIINITAFKSTIVDMHNQHRREVQASDMQALVWDESLAKQAESWAWFCRYKRSYKFSCGQNLHYTPHLVNNWMATFKAIVRAMKAWRREKMHFTYGPDCRHACAYSQMIWAKAVRIGCALNRCPIMEASSAIEMEKTTLFVCFYTPGGDIANEYPYIAGIPCANCPLGTVCDSGLCVQRAPVPDSLILAPSNLLGPEVAPRPGIRGNVPERIPVEVVPPVTTTPLPICTPILSNEEVHVLLTATNSLRDMQNLEKLAWSDELEGWARYVIRCHLEFPGPRSAYTNFGKTGSVTPLHQIVYEWGAEGDNPLIITPSGGCRTPADSKECNHYTSLMAPTLTRMACAACVCGVQRQLTCIYDDRFNS